MKLFQLFLLTRSVYCLSTLVVSSSTSLVPGDFLCNGTADAATLQDAIDALNITNTLSELGGVIVLTDGAFYLNASSIRLKAGVSLVGQAGQTILADGSIEMASHTALISLVVNGSISVSTSANVTFEQLVLHAGAFKVNNSDTVVIANSSLVLSNLTAILTTNLLLSNNTLTASILNGVTIDKCTGLIANNTISGSGGSGISIVSAFPSLGQLKTTGMAVVSNNVTRNGGDGINVTGTTGVLLVKNRISGNGGSCIAVTGSTGTVLLANLCLDGHPVVLNPPNDGIDASGQTGVSAGSSGGFGV